MRDFSPMKTSRLRILCILFALWLPTQALAGALAACISLQSDPVSTAVPGALVSGAMVSETAEPDCHGHSSAASDILSVTDDATMTGSDHQHTQTCFHCDGHCNSVQNLTLPSLAILFVDRTDTQVFSLKSATRAGFTNTPQRPPAYFLSV